MPNKINMIPITIFPMSKISGCPLMTLAESGIDVRTENKPEKIQHICTYPMSLKDVFI